MAATSDTTKFIQGIWNALRNHSALLAFRAGKNVTGGYDYDISLGRPSVPRGEDRVPPIEHSPAITVQLAAVPIPTSGPQCQGRKVTTLAVEGWILCDDPDDFHRYLDLIGDALLDGAEMNFVDATSPGLVSVLPNIESVNFEQGEITDENELAKNWRRGEIRVVISHRFNF